MRSVYFLLFCLVAISVNVHGQEAPGELTIEEIIEMVEAGISDPVIIQEIRTSTLQHEPSVQDILNLKSAGASDRIIQAVTSPVRRISGVRYRDRARGTHPRFELFGGFQYTRDLTIDDNTFGWAVDFEGNLNEWLSIIGDVSGGYGDVFNIGVSTYSFTAGPQFSIRGDPVRGFFRVLVGGARSSILGLSNTEMIAAVGGGVDLGISDRIAFRVFQVDYVHTITGVSADALRIAAGPVFRF